MDTATASYTYAGKDLNHDWIETASAIPDVVIANAVGGGDTVAEFIATTTRSSDIDNMIKQNQIILRDDITVTEVYYNARIFSRYAGSVNIIGETIDELTGATREVEALIDVDAVQAPYVDVGAQINEALRLCGVSLIDVIDDDSTDVTRGWRMVQAIDSALKSGVDVTIWLMWRPLHVA